MREHNRFTLVELLVVIGIIAVLASLILPAVVGAQQQGRITQAKSDMSAITMALKGMQNTYGKMVTKSGSGSTAGYKFNGNSATIWKTGTDEAGICLGSASGDDAYDAFIAELTVPAAKEGNSFRVASSDLNTNKRRIVLLDPQPGFDPSLPYAHENNKPKLWRDPWGSQYCILIRTSSSVYLEHPAKHKSVPSSPNKDKLLSSDIAIYSFGPNTKDNYGDNVERGGAQETDDIVSWE